MSWKTNSTLITTQPEPESAYAAQAYLFMKSWLRGQQEFILHTSGSTGVPKDIVVRRSQLSASATMTGAALGLGKGTRALVCLNVSYIAGVMMLVRGMELGWELTIVEPSSNPLLELEDRTFDFVAMVPMQLTAILADEKTKPDVNGLGQILLGGAPVSLSLKKQIQDLQLPVYQSYGMTETVSHVALRKLNMPAEEHDYTILPGIDFGQDNGGCIYLSGEVTGHEKIQTNDLIEITSDRTFHWLGRFDNVINSGGVKIVLDKVDETIAEVLDLLGQTHPFFSWYQPDDILGQKLILLMEGKGADGLEEKVLSEIRKRVSGYETPKHVYFVEKFVKTPTDKIDKKATMASVLC